MRGARPGGPSERSERSAPCPAPRAPRAPRAQGSCGLPPAPPGSSRLLGALPGSRRRRRRRRRPAGLGEPPPPRPPLRSAGCRRGREPEAAAAPGAERSRAAPRARPAPPVPPPPPRARLLPRRAAASASTYTSAAGSGARLVKQRPPRRPNLPWVPSMPSAAARAPRFAARIPLLLVFAAAAAAAGERGGGRGLGEGRASLRTHTLALRWVDAREPGESWEGPEEGLEPGVRTVLIGPVPSFTCKMLTVYGGLADVSVQTKGRDGGGSKIACVCVGAGGRLNVTAAGWRWRLSNPVVLEQRRQDIHLRSSPPRLSNLLSLPVLRLNMLFAGGETFSLNEIPLVLNLEVCNFLRERPLSSLDLEWIVMLSSPPPPAPPLLSSNFRTSATLSSSSPTPSPKLR